MIRTSDVLSASRNGSRLLLLLMSRKPLQTASSSITGHQDGDEVSKKIISTVHLGIPEVKRIRYWSFDKPTRANAILKSDLAKLLFMFLIFKVLLMACIFRQYGGFLFVFRPYQGQEPLIITGTN
jgi:hypothetical protein